MINKDYSKPKIVNKDGSFNCNAFIINENYYIMAESKSNGRLPYTIESIRNLTNGNLKIIKRGGINEYFKKYKITLLNWDGNKVTEEYNKYNLLKNKKL